MIPTEKVKYRNKIIVATNSWYKTHLFIENSYHY